MNRIHLLLSNDNVDNINIDDIVNQLVNNLIPNNIIPNNIIPNNLNLDNTIEENGGLLLDELELLNSYIVYNKLEGICTICRSEYNTFDEITELSCGHKFHKSCLDIWLSNKITCPVCRYSIRDSNKELLKIMFALNVYNSIFFGMVPILYSNRLEEDDDRRNLSWWDRFKNIFGRYINRILT
jgi:hypothetical protein